MAELIIKDSGVLARAELDIQISTAKAYPRDEQKAVEKAINRVTMTREVAESCIYCLIRKGKDGNTEIKGGSIRLAEIMATCWGNLHNAVRIVENDGKFITAQGMSWDLESNVKMPAEVKRKITGKDGRTFSEDMQGITANAACSIALRNAIFRSIGKAIVDIVYDAAVKHAVGDQKTFSSRRQEIFNRFNKMGIETQKIFDFFGKASLEEFDQDDIVDLIGIGTAIKEGTLKIDKAFSKDIYEEIDTEDKLKSLMEYEQEPGSNG